MAPLKPAKQLCADDAAAEAISTLGSTVGTFATRINRKLKEKEALDGVSQKAAESRHSLMLQAMTTIRRALQETCKIMLGDRFRFNLVVTDWEGWPRVELNLIDRFAPERIDFSMIVTAHDRNELGAVKIAMKTGEILGQVHLRDPEEFRRLPLILKRSVRQFLDLVANYVLDPIKPEDLVEMLTKPIDDESADEDVVSKKLAGEDVFTDDQNFKNENILSEEDAVPPLGAALSILD